MTDTAATPDDIPADETEQPLVKRHRLSTRIWHWINAVTLLLMLMSGLMIFNAHPHLYWGQYGANYDDAWLEIGHQDDEGFLRVGNVTLETTGVLGRWHDPGGNVQTRAFPWWSTMPSFYSLAQGRLWHFFFAWVLVIAGIAYWIWSFANGHVRRDLAPEKHELTPRHIWKDIADHARLRFPAGKAALKYNILQKLSYLGVLFVLLPLMVLTGLTMSPNMDAAWGGLLSLFGGRQTARSIHFICAWALVAFFVVHIAMVLLAGPFNEVRSMITGRFRLPKERDQ